MPPPRAALAAVALVLLAGCAGALDDRPAAADPGDPGTVPSDPAHEVRVENHLSSARNVTVAVSQAGEVVHAGTYRVPPNGSIVAYGWEPTPPGNATFVVRMEPADGPARRETVEVTDCLGNVVGYFGDEGFGLTYSVC